MGIKGLMSLLNERSPKALKERELDAFFGRKVAMDASMCIYGFLIAMKGAFGGEQELMNEEGEVTSHLLGMFHRTARMLSKGIKPIYVFDGKPPDMKRVTLAGRTNKAEEAKEKLEAAKEDGDQEELIKQSKRTVRATKEQTEECKKLLTLMGVPVVQAPSEAEATCSALVSAGLCWATGTEDMDALTFGTPILVRHLTVSQAAEKKGMGPVEINLEEAYNGLGMTREQFIDLCLLLGCDYLPRIPGIGPHRAFQAIKEHGSIEEFLKKLDKTKHKLPEEYPYEEARQLFKEPEVIDPSTVNLNFTLPDEEGLIKFLVDEKMFARERVEKVIKTIKDSLKKKTQMRLDGFVKVVKSDSTPVKRKREEDDVAGRPAKRAKVAAKAKPKKGGKQAMRSV